jgi:hypothetical protein
MLKRNDLRDRIVQDCWVSNIEGRQTKSAIIGVATEDGRAYFRITSLLKRIQLPFTDIILKNSRLTDRHHSRFTRDYVVEELKLIVTTRKERLKFLSSNVVCIEDLGDDIGIAKERLLPYLHNFDADDSFLIGIDPGERTGVVAFMNQHEVDSSVLISLDDALNRVMELIDNAPTIKKMVRIGAGAPVLADRIARQLYLRYREKLRIQLVDERGTSSLNFREKGRFGTRDQFAAKLIAFREGKDFVTAG